MTSLFMWSWSRGWAVKVEKVKGEEAGVLQKHTPLPHAHIHMQTVGMQAEHMHACTHPRTNYRVNSCSLTSCCCRYDWGEEKRRSKESGEREERGGKDGGASSISFWTICSYSLQITVHKANAKSPVTLGDFGVWLECSRFANISRLFKIPIWTDSRKTTFFFGGVVHEKFSRNRMRQVNKCLCVNAFEEAVGKHHFTCLIMLLHPNIQRWFQLAS